MAEEKKDSNSKSISLTPTLTSMLNPTTEYLGSELKEFVKDNVEKWKKNKREKNLKTHLESVSKSLVAYESENNVKERTIEQLSFFEEWVEGAQDVDIENEELSQIWQGILQESALGYSHTRELLVALKSLTPAEAKFLIERKSQKYFNTGTLELNNYIIKSLESKNLLTPSYRDSINYFIGYFVVVTATIAITSTLDISPIRITLMMVFGGLSFIGLITYFQRVGFSTWEVTWLGQKLMESCIKY
ncbi:hypothetical protein L0668_14510 [Paraglaciecola aquimarina]|uniref:Uncharacterized protein n=1 Tax=Paraglaciecola algarum TaxID=3050085 RepID=A0ABS9DBE3_9ALTE|nr:hypothetical protein [Paraglaciecola sp. G1-23]MCF2949328.1 hypothetical protein [Paraglaciecola sp. G1-23]